MHVSGYFKMPIKRINLIIDKPLLELSSVVNSIAPIVETAARIRLVTMTFFRPNLKFQIKASCTISWNAVETKSSVDTNHI